MLFCGKADLVSSELKKGAHIGNIGIVIGVGARQVLYLSPYLLLRKVQKFGDNYSCLVALMIFD